MVENKEKIESKERLRDGRTLMLTKNKAIICDSPLQSADEVEVMSRDEYERRRLDETN